MTGNDVGNQRQAASIKHWSSKINMEQRETRDDKNCRSVVDYNATILNKWQWRDEWNQMDEQNIQRDIGCEPSNVLSIWVVLDCVYNYF